MVAVKLAFIHSRYIINAQDELWDGSELYHAWIVKGHEYHFGGTSRVSERLLAGDHKDTNDFLFEIEIPVEMGAVLILKLYESDATTNKIKQLYHESPPDISSINEFSYTALRELTVSSIIEEIRGGYTSAIGEILVSLMIDLTDFELFDPDDDWGGWIIKFSVPNEQPLKVEVSYPAKDVNCFVQSRINIIPVDEDPHELATFIISRGNDIQIMSMIKVIARLID